MDVHGAMSTQETAALYSETKSAIHSNPVEFGAIPQQPVRISSRKRFSLWIGIMALSVSNVLLLFVMLFHKDEKKEYFALMAADTDEEIEDVYVYDFDGDGKREAFVVTQSSDSPEYSNLWFVSD